MFDRLINFIHQNEDITPDFEMIPLTEQQNRFQYVGGQIDNGKLYSIVNSAEKMLKYDINLGSMEFVGQFPKRDFKWTGGCVYENKLYFFPRSENCLLSYDFVSSEFEEINCELNYDGEHHYSGVCTTDGIIYQSPRNTDHILKWDIRKKTCEKIYINKKHAYLYCGSVIHPNGNIYFIPEREFPVIKMDIKTEKITYIDRPVSCNAFDPVVAANGNYMASVREMVVF